MADQPLNPNYKYGAITTALAGKSGLQKHQIKANALRGNIQNFLPFTYVRRGITITVTQVGVVGDNGDLFMIVATAAIGGLPLNVDNPLYFKNPPIMAPDGTTYVDPSDGQTKQTMKEDLLEAAKEIVCQTIELQNKL